MQFATINLVTEKCLFKKCGIIITYANNHFLLLLPRLTDLPGLPNTGYRVSGIDGHFDVSYFCSVTDFTMSRIFVLLFFMRHTYIFQFIKGNWQLLHNTWVSKVDLGEKRHKSLRREMHWKHYLAFHTINIRRCGSLLFQVDWQYVNNFNQPQ